MLNISTVCISQMLRIPKTLRYYVTILRKQMHLSFTKKWKFYLTNQVFAATPFYDQCTAQTRRPTKIISRLVWKPRNKSSARRIFFFRFQNTNRNVFGIGIVLNWTFGCNISVTVAISTYSLTRSFTSSWSHIIIWT